MHMSGSIGGVRPATLAAMGVPLPSQSSAAPVPPAFAAAWGVPEYLPQARLTVPPSGMPTAEIDKNAAQVFDLFSPARSAPANTYFVAPSGNDSTGTGAFATPWRSIGKAVAAANASGQPAQIKVAAGSYPRANNFTNGNTVHPTVDIAFIAYGGRVMVGTFDDFAAPAADATSDE